MTIDDLQTLLASQIAANVTNVYFMLYDDNGVGGTKCEIGFGTTTDMAGLAAQLADYNYVDPTDTAAHMMSFINKSCTATIATTPIQPSVAATPVVAPDTTATIVQPTITGTVTKDDGTTTTTTTTGTDTIPETAATTDTATTPADTTTADTTSTATPTATS